MLRKSEVAPLASVVALAAALLTTATVLQNKEESRIQKEMETTKYVSVKDVEKFKSAVEEGTITWKQALESLKAESKIQKAYFEGAQMVRDSIKNAAKSIK